MFSVKFTGTFAAELIVIYRCDYSGKTECAGRETKHQSMFIHGLDFAASYYMNQIVLVCSFGSIGCTDSFVQIKGTSFLAVPCFCKKKAIFRN